MARSNDEVRKYRNEISNCGDAELIDAIDALLAGDESQREFVEEGLDQIDIDEQRFSEPLGIKKQLRPLDTGWDRAFKF